MCVKLFWNNFPTQALEDRINAWLVEHPGIRVVEVKQSATGGSFIFPSLWLVSVWYEEGTERPVAGS
jgi:hypothetical protein